MELSLKELDKLESEPTTKGIMKSLTICLLGTIFLAISVFAITAKNLEVINYVICTISGIIGLIGWILGFISYNKTKTKIEQQNTTLIEEQYNTIYDCCEKDNKLTK